MAAGRLGTAADLAATTNTTLYTNATTYAVASVTLCNRNSTAVSIRLALSATATPGNAEYIEYGTTIPANGVLERTGLVVGATQNLVAYASATGVSAVVYGIET